MTPKRTLHDGRRLCGSASILTLQERLWRHIDISGGLLACWPWAGARSKKRAGTARGHIRDRATGRHYLAHRLALCFAGAGLEEYDRPEHACHRCHNRLCCNTYSHLYWGTDADNRMDRHQLERRQAQGFDVWQPQAWFWCNRCFTKYLTAYAPPGTSQRLNCPTCGADPVFSLVDLEYDPRLAAPCPPPSSTPAWSK